MGIAKTSTRHIARLAGVVALAVALGGCYLPLALVHQQNDPDTRPWWCESTGDGGGHAAHHYPGLEKGMLSWDDCLSVSEDLDAALAYAQQYPTLGDAEANGFSMRVAYVAGMGTHHSRGAIDDVFDPAQPEFLMYGGNDADAPLVGMAWYVRKTDGTPPPGFAGDNDWWHVHEYLCISNETGLVIGDGLSDEDCAARNGFNVYLGDYWMLHAWIVPGWQYHPDVFVGHHPCLKADGPAPADDACWDLAYGTGGV